MRSEKVILLRHLVALLAVSSATSWIQSVQGLKFSPIKEITLGTEITIDWTGQPSLGNVEQSVVLMKDGNALLTLCQGQITGSGQCSFELKKEHQVLGDGYQLAMQGMDGVALDYSAEFSIKAGDVKVGSSSSGGEENVEEKGDEDEGEIEVVEDKDDGEDEENDTEEQGDGDDDDAKVEKERTGHDDDHDEESEEDNNMANDDDDEDNNMANDDDDEDNGGAKKKDRKKKHGYQKSQVHEQKAKDNEQQQHHHHSKQQKDKKLPKQHKQKEEQQQQMDGYYKQQVDKLIKTFQQQQKVQRQHRFTVESTGTREQRAKEAARLLEKNRLAPPMAHAAEPPRARVIVSASNDADESNKDSNIGIGIKPVLGNDALLELMPEDPVQKLATGAVAGDTDEIDMELADELAQHPNNEDKKDKQEKEKRAEQSNAEGKEDAEAETKYEAEPSTWDKIFGGIAMFSKNVGTTVANGFTKVQHVIVGGGAHAPEGELFKHKYAIAGGSKYHFVEEGNPTDPVLLLIHGFPDLWYGWRHQIKVFAEKGYRVIAIDCLGYGDTELDYLAAWFEKTGFEGPLNYYKTGMINHIEELEHPTRNKNMSYPVYLIKGENDPVLIPELAVTMPYLYKNYSTHSIQTGHFATLEKPQEFNEVLEEILTTIYE
ncbi:hypothetical protein BGZ91_009478 [Linnemannia elongata]|nr:hypothetical protein BGZ91_009478 [Linnemannia elongata]